MNNTITKCGLNLIKSWFKPGFILLSILFTLGVGQMKAATIPAGTTIYVDVSNFSATYNSGYYLSVTASTNSSYSMTKSNTAGAASYKPKNDTPWYTLTQVSGNIYSATIASQSTVGKITIWSKNESSYNDVWEVNVATATYDGTHDLLTISSGYSTHNDRRACCFNSTWSTYDPCDYFGYAPSAVVSGTNVMFYFQGYASNNYLTNGSGRTAITTASNILTSTISYANITKEQRSTYYYVSNNVSGWDGNANNGIKTANGGELFRADGTISTTAAKTAATTTSVAGDVLNISTTCNSATGVYSSKQLYIQYYIGNTFAGVTYSGNTAICNSIPASTSSRTSTYDVSELSDGTYTLKTILTDGIVYYIADTDNFTVSHSTYSLTVSKGTGISSVTGSNDDITLGTKYAISATVSTGYSFSGWTASPAANGVFDNASSASTNVTVNNGSVTVTASATENKHNVTVYYKCGSTTITANTASNVGEANTTSVSAPSITGYTFSNWTVGSGVTATTSTSSSPISIKTKSSGTYSLTANYTEDLSSPWIVAGGNKIVTTGTTWRTTADANNSMLKKTGHSAESVVYFTVPISAICEGDNNGDYQFKIYNTSTGNWYGLAADGDSYYLLKAEDGVEKSLANAKNIELRAYILGDYELKLDYSAATPKLTVTWPNINQLQVYTANELTTGDAAIGSWDWTSTAGTVSSKTLTLQAKTQYKFKVVYNSDYYGFKTGSPASGDNNPDHPMTIDNCTDWRVYNDGGDSYLYAPVAGSYTFNFNSNNSGNTTLSVDFPAASPITYGVGTLVGGGDVTVSPSFTSGDYILRTQAITFTRGATTDGYTWKGWYNNPAGTGDALGTGSTYTSAANTRTTNTEYAFYACYQYANYTVTLDKQTSATGYGSSGTCTNPTVTYNTTLPAISGSMPSGTGYYGFDGFYTATGGGGVKVINADGTWVNNATGYTSSDGKWMHTSAITLYAYYKQAEITGITLNAGIFEPAEAEGEKVYVKADPIIAPTPGGTTTVCWELRYSNDNPIEGHAPIADTEGGTKLNQVKFELNGLAAGGYKIHAELRSGSDCAGTLLSSYDKSFSIANDHTVTIYYRLDTEDGPIIKASTTSPGKPLDPTEISAPTIVGYEFNRWKAGDGVTIDAENDSDGDGISEDNTISYTAIYDGKLTAIYTKRRMIYFMNTLGWSGVTVYFYKNGSYWNDTEGTGSSYTDKYTNTPFSESKYGTMTQIEGTNIWYWDAAANGVNANYTNVVFTEKTQYNYHFFSYQSGTTPNRVIRRGDYSPAMSMFVPLADQEGKSMNSGQAYYYNEGYWMNYSENTGYTLRIFDDPMANSGTGATRTLTFPYSEDIKMPLKLDVDFNFTGEAWFLIYRHDGTLLGAEANITQENRDAAFTSGYDYKLHLQTSAPGIYTFTLTFHDDGANPKNYNYYINVDYPVSVGDYRILYKDNDKWSQAAAHNASWSHTSDIIRKNTGSEEKSDTVSLFVSYGSTISAKFQKVSSINASTGVVTWADVASGTIDLSGISKKGVYNFIVSQPAGGESISLSKTEEYTGNFYIRTDCAGNTKWDSYRTRDHQMPYTDFSMSDANTFGDKFSHYYAHWCPAGTNIKFCVANDYSACISDTLTKDVGEPYKNLDGNGTLLSDGNGDATANRYSANVRFMYNSETNKLSRAYISAATNAARKFLVLYCEDGKEILDENGSALAGTGETPRQAIFHDNENFIYERVLQIVPGTRFKLFASYALVTPTRLDSVQYFRGTYASDAFSSDENSVVLLSGTGGAQKLRVIYDFKTNRLVAAWMPSDEPVSGTLDIDADVMIIRDHHQAAECITFANSSSKLDGVKTVYGAMKFNRWTLNNRARGKNGKEDNDKDHCDTPEDIIEYHPILDAGEQKSIYERSLYFISFPFDVKVSEIFGFGHYWDEWYLEYYDGLNRAKNGYWKDSPPNWKYVTPEMADTMVLRAYQGYILGLDLDYMEYDNTAFWANNISNVELYFPSQTTISSIKQTEVTIPALGEKYRCTINRGTSEGDRRIKDSFWRCIGVPSYNEFAGELTSGKGGSTINWQTSYSTFPFLYAWNMSDNTLTPQNTSTFAFKPMHAYLVQIQDAIYWNMVSATPSPIVARRERAENVSEYNWCLTLNQDSTFMDQTYVRMSNMEQVTDSFDFGQDLVKELNATRSNIYTLVGYERLAANSMPVETGNTTIVPLGLNIRTAGDYTFAMPEGTSGVGITLVDNATGVRTNLSALDYTVNLTAGDYTNRFFLEISPVKEVGTDIEGVSDQHSDIRKVLINGILYIVKDNKIFDARGARVE